ncbi:MAG: TVP38/TMEM64 family protein [Spirochaetia bacterium]
MAQQKSPVRLVVLIVLIGAVLGLGWYFDAQSYLRDVLEWIRDRGAAGVALFICVYIVATVLFIPGSILTLGAGFVYGVVLGTVWVSIASTIGATAAFIVGRYFARGWVSVKVSGSERFASIDDAVGREGWKIVGLTRLSPIFPYNLLNYAYGLTKVSLRDYFFASWIGMLPGTVMYIYIGSLAGDLATIGGERSRSPVDWVIYGLGFVATITVTVFVTRLARKALTRSNVGSS